MPLRLFASVQDDATTSPKPTALRSNRMRAEPGWRATSAFSEVRTFAAGIISFTTETNERYRFKPCAVNERKESPLARRRFQRGYLFLKQNRREALWVGRFKEDVLVNGRVRRIKRAEVLGSKKDYPTRRLALRALAERLSKINSTTYRPRPTATFDSSQADGQLMSWDNSSLRLLRTTAPMSVGISLRFLARIR